MNCTEWRGEQGGRGPGHVARGILLEHAERHAGEHIDPDQHRGW